MLGDLDQGRLFNMDSNLYFMLITAPCNAFLFSWNCPNIAMQSWKWRPTIIRLVHKPKPTWLSLLPYSGP